MEQGHEYVLAMKCRNQSQYSHRAATNRKQLACASQTQAHPWENQVGSECPSDSIKKDKNVQMKNKNFM